jgi:hypothetical protein
MSLLKEISFRRALKAPKTVLNNAAWFLRGLARTEALDGTAATLPPANDLQRYFDGVQSGHGIWKWQHYFEIYDRHFSKFRNKQVNVLEIGIYSGGSLGMWRNYFGDGCTVFGVDIADSCRVYEADGIRVFIGDQADRDFWTRFKEQTPKIDLVIDDGGHEPLQQLVSFEELFPHLNPGGIYLCEDIAGKTQRFAAYVSGLSCQMHASPLERDATNDERRLVVKASPFQSVVHSIHVYPFVAVVEKRSAPIAEFVAPKHGTQWQPFLRYIGAYQSR